MLCLQAYDAFFSLVCTHCKLLIGYYLLSLYYLLHSGRLPTPLSITLELFSSSGSILSFLASNCTTPCCGFCIPFTIRQYAFVITKIEDDSTVLCGAELELELLTPRHELFFLGACIFISYYSI